MRQVVRIIGGTYRGKKIHFSNEKDLRPTPSRIRETLFNWLAQDIVDKSCLDAFAGSGALGFEALSRGAKAVVLLEASLATYKQLKKVAMDFKTPKLRLHHGDALAFFKTIKTPFDIIFLDPPFAEAKLSSSLLAISQFNCLAKEGLIYVESDKPIDLLPEYFELVKAKKAGQVYYGLLRLKE